MTGRTTRLRRLPDAPEILVAPGAYDGTGAKMIKALGFQAFYLSGFETSAAVPRSRPPAPSRPLDVPRYFMVT